MSDAFNILVALEITDCEIEMENRNVTRIRR